MSTDINDPVLEGFNRSNKSVKNFKSPNSVNDPIPSDPDKFREIVGQANNGDMYALFMLGKNHYTQGNKERAFKYFDAVIDGIRVNSQNHTYISAIASYVGKRKQGLEKALQYHRNALALSFEAGKGKRNWDSWNYLKKHGKRHAELEYVYYRRKKGQNHNIPDNQFLAEPELYNEYVSNLSEGNFPKNNSEVKALCIECPREKLETVLGKGRAQDYIKHYQCELADEILAAEMREKNMMSRDEIIAQYSKPYHADYLEGLDKIIEEQVKRNAENIQSNEQAIVISGRNILFDLKKSVLKNTRELLVALSPELSTIEEVKIDDGFTALEKATLQKVLIDIRGEDREKGAENNYSTDFDGSVEEASKKLSQYLQLQAFSEVAKALDITWEDPKPSAPVKEGFVAAPAPAYPVFDGGKEMDPAGAEVKNSLVNKLVKVAEVIDRVNQDIQKKAKKDNLKISTLSEFFTDALKSIGAVLSLVGIKLMYDSHQEFGTHKFWKGEAEKQQIRTDKVKQKAANDARSSLFKSIGHHHERAKDEKKHHDVLEQQKKAHGRIRKS